MALISLEQAKRHLRVTTDDNNADIELKVEQAEAMVLERCNSTAYWRAITPTWTDATIPLSVQSAIFLVLTHLYEHRGDDMRPDKELWDAIDRVLAFNRDPALA